MGQHGFKQGQSRGGVVAKEDLRPHHRFAGLDQGGKMQHAVKGLCLAFGRNEDLLKSQPILQFSLDELHASGQEVSPPMAQIVKDDRLMAFFSQQSYDCTTYVPRTAGDQYLHNPPYTFSSTLVYPKVYYRGQVGLASCRSLQTVSKDGKPYSVFLCCLCRRRAWRL